MASLSTDKNGNRKIQFFDSGEERRTIYLGKIPKKTAATIKMRVEHLVVAQRTGLSLDLETALWVANIDDRLAKKLSDKGLIEPRENLVVPNLEKFLDGYIAGRANLKPNTERNYNVTRDHLVNHFGAQKKLKDISPGDADQWRESLLKTRSAATVSREVKRAKQFFRAAVRKRYLAENPFADLATPAQVNNTRDYFVPQSDIYKILAECPDNQWKLIIALARFGGLRTPSETLLLRFGDVDWDKDRITIRSPKTAHHPGGDQRVIPLFPELRPYLDAVYEEAEEGQVFFITRYRDKGSNLRTQFERFIDRAKVDRWPKLFHNLRSSRETELTATFPEHVVCKWLGNSVSVARKHYLQVTDEHFAQAIKNDAKSDALTTQNPTQSVAAEVSSDSQETKKAQESRAILPPDTAQCESTLDGLAPPRGVEPLFSG